MSYYREWTIDSFLFVQNACWSTCLVNLCSLSDGILEWLSSFPLFLPPYLYLRGFSVWNAWGAYIQIPLYPVLTSVFCGSVTKHFHSETLYFSNNHIPHCAIDTQMNICLLLCNYNILKTASAKGWAVLIELCLNHLSPSL